MRILFGVHGYKPAWRIGGPVISVSAVAERLVQRGHEVIVFTSNSNLDEDLQVETDRPLDVDGVQVWYFARQMPLKSLFRHWSYLSRSIGFLYCPRMRRELERLVPTVDLVHTHLPFNYPGFASAHAAFRYGKPLFYHQRGVLDPERLKFRSLKKSLYIKYAERPILRRATTLIALTEYEVESYRRLGVETPCRVIPNGIDAERYSTSRENGELVSRLGIPPDSRVILFLGRIHPIKGADKLLEAFLLVQQRCPEAVLVLAGPDEFNMESAFRRRAEASGLAHRVIFPGMVYGLLKAKLLSRADLFCLPSDAEGFSMAVLEAMASGTAVLLSPGCHFPEVESFGAGRVSSTEPAVLASALLELISNPDSLEGMGQRARALVSAKYSWDRITDTLIETYEEGLKRRGNAVAYGVVS